MSVAVPFYLNNNDYFNETIKRYNEYLKNKGEE
jgi:hypothetical protein